MDEQDNRLNEYLPRVTFEAIPINELVTDQDYQRVLSEKHVKKAVKDFDLYQINPVKVSRRDGKNYVFNGQHTIEIVAEVSGSRETPVWCMVYNDLEYISEANVFANQQKHIKYLTPYEIFNANIEAGNNSQLLIKELVESYDLTISNKAKPSSIRAVGALEYIYNHYGYEVLNRTLRLTIETWEGSSTSFTSGILKGIARVLSVYDTDVKDDIFVDKLSSVSEKEVIRTSKERNNGALGYAETIVVYYNKKTHNGLPMQKLYMRTPKKKINFEEEDNP